MSDFSEKSGQELARHLKGNALRVDGPFVLRSGKRTDWYLDARQTTFDGAGALLVAQAVLEILDPAVEAVGGMTMGADPVAVATAVVAAQRSRQLRAFSIRKGAKDHGTGGRLVGPVKSGMSVAVVEDTTTTGGALLEAIQVAREAGLSVIQAVALVDRSGGQVSDALSLLSIPYTALLLPIDLGMEG